MLSEDKQAKSSVTVKHTHTHTQVDVIREGKKREIHLGQESRQSTEQVYSKADQKLICSCSINLLLQVGLPPPTRAIVVHRDAYFLIPWKSAQAADLKTR